MVGWHITYDEEVSYQDEKQRAKKSSLMRLINQISSQIITVHDEKKRQVHFQFSAVCLSFKAFYLILWDRYFFLKMTAVKMVAKF